MVGNRQDTNMVKRSFIIIIIFVGLAGHGHGAEATSFRFGTKCPFFFLNKWDHDAPLAF